MSFALCQHESCHERECFETSLQIMIIFAFTNALVFSLNHLFFLSIILCIIIFKFYFFSVSHLRQLFHLWLSYFSQTVFQSDIKQIVKSFIVSTLKMILDTTKP